MTASEAGFIGRVLHYYARPGVAVVEVAAKLCLGDVIRVEARARGAPSPVHEVVESMESEHRKLSAAEVGQVVAIALRAQVRPNDRIYRIDGVTAPGREAGR